MRIALVGTRGVPARYGGFETAMEEVGRRLVERGHDVTVYCRNGNSGQPADPDEHLGMRLVHLPALRHRSLETLSHTFLSATHLAFSPRRFDAVVMCNGANSVALPLFHAAGTPVAVNVDGLEWRRSKWGRTARRYYRAAEGLSVRWADALVADARGIADSYWWEFGAGTQEIPYGAPDLSGTRTDRLGELGLQPDGYHLVVARFEPENNVTFMIEGYLRSGARRPLVVVGSNPYATDYTRTVERLAARSDRVRLLGGVWDQGLLDQLYKGALTYLHGHSVGGTNPSLLRAMGAATATIAYGCTFNREVAGEHGIYAATPDEVAIALTDAEEFPVATRCRGAGLAERARARYTWDAVTTAYEQLCYSLAAGESQRTLFTGRRRRVAPGSEMPLHTATPTAVTTQSRPVMRVPGSETGRLAQLPVPVAGRHHRDPVVGMRHTEPYARKAAGDPYSMNRVENTYSMNPVEKAEHEDPGGLPTLDRRSDRRVRPARPPVGHRAHGHPRATDRGA